MKTPEELRAEAGGHVIKGGALALAMYDGDLRLIRAFWFDGYRKAHRRSRGEAAMSHTPQELREEAREAAYETVPVPSGEQVWLDGYRKALEHLTAEEWSYCNCSDLPRRKVLPFNALAALIAVAKKAEAL